MMLADYGAEVIKIEQPGSGDGTRQWGPPWLGDQSAYFLSVNRNKKSITLNLKSEAGRSILRRLIQQADVLIENFKVGTMAKLGLGYESLAAENPGLIYCAITGYGQTGPYKERPGYDFMIQAQGGMMSITGEADGEPHKVGVAIVDITAGLFASNAILAALHHRAQTGQGQMVDVALLDSQIGWLANVAHNYFATGETPGRYGNGHANIVPYQTFTAVDKPIAVAVGSDAQFERLCAIVQRPDLWQQERYQTNAGRVAHRKALVAELQAAFGKRPCAEWLDLLLAAGIPAGPVNDVATILQDPQVAARQMVQTVTHPTLGEVQVLGPVAKLSATPAQVRSAPPLLGADTTAVLAERLGMDAAEIGRLRQDGVV
jgi:crotonobetainyl-CoA:carnitine CoA-transferase CaiB-like acyl-CoA transferase